MTKLHYRFVAKLLCRHVVVAATVLLYLMNDVDAFTFRAPTTAMPNTVAVASLSTLRLSSLTAIRSAVTSNDNSGLLTIKTSGEEKDSSNKIRPFYQNWWPVATVTSLKQDRPNAIQVLGKPLVAYLDKTKSLLSSSSSSSSSSQWCILDDTCSHRFAPLSEGRVVDCHKIQCAYHGWEFRGDGVCTKVPQQPDRVNKARKVQSYRVREDLGIIWVWMDPQTTETIGESIPLPINPLVRLCHQAGGPNSVFIRDLPYGMEILGENLLDLSHLPYAHHSVGQLERSLGNELPTRMLSLAEREKAAQWETTYGPNLSSSRIPVLPLVQAEITNAADHDPIFVKSALMTDPAIKAKWTTTIAFFDPNHVRYRRSRGTPGSASHVELFMCPTSEGRSRVFLVNCFEAMLAPLNKTTSNSKDTSALFRMMSRLSPKKAIAALKQKLIRRMVATHRGHLFAHQIFDGDGIFLHKQGNRMAVADKTFKDYSTPASADVLLNSYRRFLDVAATKTREAGKDSMADAVVGTKASYGDDASRHQILDRYKTHTIHCPSCLAALQKARKKKSVVEAVKTTFQGSAGSAIAALITLAALRRASSVCVTLAVFGYVGLVTAVSIAGSFMASAMASRTQKEINSFIFEDYVHAEKN